jgi:integrase
MASVKIIHYTHKENSDGTSPVIIQVIQGTKVKKKTFASVFESQWDDKKKRIKNHPNANVVNTSLSNEFNRIENIILSGTNFDIETIFKDEDKPAPVAYSFTSYFQRMIDDTVSGKRIKPNTGQIYAHETAKHYRTALAIVRKFIAHKGLTDLKFEDINLDFYFDFKDYFLKTEGLSDNYFGVVIKVIKTVMNEAKEEKLHNSSDYQSKRFVKPAYEIENVYLDEEQLEKLAKKDLSEKPHLDRARDLFLVGCWTGLRFSDFHNIKPEDIKKDFIEIKTQKTGKAIVIPIHPALQKIIDKYSGDTPNSLPPPMVIQRLNLYIKDVMKDSEFENKVSLDKYKGGAKVIVTKKLHEWVTTHTARRSFASNMFRMGVPTIIIMAITGHKTEKAFLKYIKLTPREMAEIMREIWNKQTMKSIKHDA